MKHRALGSLRLGLATLALLPAGCSSDGDEGGRFSGGGAPPAGVGPGGVAPGGVTVAPALPAGAGAGDSAPGASMAPAVPPRVDEGGPAVSGVTGGAEPGGGMNPGGVNPGGTEPGANNPDPNPGTDTGTELPAAPQTGQPVGFATLNGGTTGGVTGQVVTVSSFADLVSFAQRPEPFVIRVEGTISNGPNGGVVRVASNKSLLGVGSTAFLNGVGIDINSSNNIILQNLRVSMLGVTTRTATPGVYDEVEGILVNDGDAISIRGTSKNIWIDHCELFAENPDAQPDIELYDGLIDIKNQTGFITISWSYLHDHHKGGLVGASDTDLFDDRKITYHHNYYEDVRLRIPMYRGAVGHFFNNYVVGATDATEIRAGTCVRVEKNYYEALHFSIYTPADFPGSTERIDNLEVDRTARAYPANCSADIPYPYAAALTTNTNDVRTIVVQLAGVGKL